MLNLSLELKEEAHIKMKKFWRRGQVIFKWKKVAESIAKINRKFYKTKIVKLGNRRYRVDTFE